MIGAVHQSFACGASGARPSLLFGPAFPRRRSLLLAEHGRPRQVLAREARIATFLAGLPPGSAVTAREVLAAVPGLRLVPGQETAVNAALRAAGWRSAGRGYRLWTRPGDELGQRHAKASRWHPEVARSADAIAAFVADRREVTAREVLTALGISLPGQRQRCVARALARLGFTPPGRGGRVWTRGSAS